MPTPEDEPATRRGRVLVAAIITVIVIALVVVHLTGLIGPGSH
jgi:hypothetical protein